MTHRPVVSDGWFTDFKKSSQMVRTSMVQNKMEKRFKTLLIPKNLSSILQVFRTYAVLSGQVEKQGIKL